MKVFGTNPGVGFLRNFTVAFDRLGYLEFMIAPQGLERGKTFVKKTRKTRLLGLTDLIQVFSYF